MATVAHNYRFIMCVRRLQIREGALVGEEGGGEGGEDEGESCEGEEEGGREEESRADARYGRSTGSID